MTEDNKQPKQCNKCQKVQAWEEFGKHVAFASGRDSTCKTCRKAQRLARNNREAGGERLPDLKTCINCSKERVADLANFYADPKAKDGFDSRCIQCRDATKPGTPSAEPKSRVDLIKERKQKLDKEEGRVIPLGTPGPSPAAPRPIAKAPKKRRAPRKPRAPEPVAKAAPLVDIAPSEKLTNEIIDLAQIIVNGRKLLRQKAVLLAAALEMEEHDQGND